MKEYLYTLIESRLLSNTRSGDPHSSQWFVHLMGWQELFQENIIGNCNWIYWWKSNLQQGAITAYGGKWATREEGHWRRVAWIGEEISVSIMCLEKAEHGDLAKGGQLWCYEGGRIWSSWHRWLSTVCNRTSSHSGQHKVSRWRSSSWWLKVSQWSIKSQWVMQGIIMEQKM